MHRAMLELGRSVEQSRDPLCVLVLVTSAPAAMSALNIPRVITPRSEHKQSDAQVIYASASAPCPANMPRFDRAWLSRRVQRRKTLAIAAFGSAPYRSSIEAIGDHPVEPRGCNIVCMMNLHTR